MKARDVMWGEEKEKYRVPAVIRKKCHSKKVGYTNCILFIIQTLERKQDKKIALTGRRICVKIYDTVDLYILAISPFD